MIRPLTASTSVAAMLLAAIAVAAPAISNAASANPGPASKHASKYSEISIRGVPASKAGKITVRGGRTGFHSYSRKRHSDNRGFSLVMKKAFAVSETVRVSSTLPIAGAKRGDYSFKVENLGGPRNKKYSNASLSDGGPAQFKSRPDLLPPTLNVRRNLDSAGQDPLLVGAKNRGTAIYENDGNPIWFRSGRSTDFRTGTYKGKPVLTWVEAPTAGSGLKRTSYTIANRAYKVIKRFTPGNAYAADSHEFRLTKRNTAFVTSYRTVKADLRHLGLSANGRVSDSIAQEVDLRSGRVIWEWHSLDHVPIKQSYAKGPKFPGQPYDYFHINSVIDTPDGNVMISGRSTNTVYKVSRHTGRVIWALGGKRSDYKLSKKAKFSWQHDAQPLSGNRVSLFDNSDSPVAAKPWANQSRGLILKLNNKKKTATVSDQFKNPLKPLSPTQANVQALSSGNYLVAFGQIPIISEFGPSGNMVYDATVDTSGGFYRAYRQSWVGLPKTAVDVATEPNGDKTKLWASWNGDSRVVTWRVLAGPTEDNLSPVGEFPRTGFETTMNAATADSFVKVEGVNPGGKTIGSSAVKKVR
ncbi:MAG: arylsulfotransferase family protein [Solirubrobacterales bacterium]